MGNSPLCKIIIPLFFYNVKSYLLCNFASQTLLYVGSWVFAFFRFFAITAIRTRALLKYGVFIFFKIYFSTFFKKSFFYFFIFLLILFFVRFSFLLIYQRFCNILLSSIFPFFCLFKKSFFQFNHFLIFL